MCRYFTLTYSKATDPILRLFIRKVLNGLRPSYKSYERSTIYFHGRLDLLKCTTDWLLFSSLSAPLPMWDLSLQITWWTWNMPSQICSELLLNTYLMPCRLWHRSLVLWAGPGAVQHTGPPQEYARYRSEGACRGLEPGSRDATSIMSLCVEGFFLVAQTVKGSDRFMGLTWRWQWTIMAMRKSMSSWMSTLKQSWVLW